MTLSNIIQHNLSEFASKSLPRSVPITRLDFRLHDFTRWTWVSDRAQEIWQPRIQKVLACWKELEWRSVPAGIRSGAMIMVGSQQVAELETQLAPYHLKALPVQQIAVQSTYATTSAQVEAGKPYNYLMAIGSEATVTALKTAWDYNQQGEVGRLLGYPTCCHQFYERVWVQSGLIDTTWSMALNTSQCQQHDHVCQICSPAQGNILLRWLGVRSVPHLPCSFDCAATLKQAEQFLELGQELGYSEEIEWLLEMLNWSIEWSALHGIAEIKTPIFKITTLTDATAEKCVVRREGNSSPEAGGKGLGFPYQTLPQSKLMCN